MPDDPSRPCAISSNRWRVEPAQPLLPNSRRDFERARAPVRVNLPLGSLIELRFPTPSRVQFTVPVTVELASMRRPPSPGNSIFVALLTTPLATKTHPRRLPNPPSKRISLPDTVRSAPNPLLHTMNPGLAKQKMAVRHAVNTPSSLRAIDHLRKSISTGQGAGSRRVSCPTLLQRGSSQPPCHRPGRRHGGLVRHANPHLS